MSQKAWEIERQIRLNALPLERRVHPSRWSEQVSSISKNHDSYTRYWKNHVPGSGAPDSLYVGMVQSMANKGFDVSEAEALLPLGLELAEKNDLDSLRPLTALLMEKTFQAPKNSDSPYWHYQHPLTWEGIVADMSPDIERTRSTQPLDGLIQKIYHGWIGQLAGGSFSTALEGYSGEQLFKVYGEIFAAVLTSLSFAQPDIHLLIHEAAKYLPQRSEYSAILSEALTILKYHNDPQTSWKILDERFKEYNWIHAYPNLAADLLALWYGAGDMSSSFSLLAMAGLDVDCNGGLVGNILGIIKPVPEQWSAPLGDLLETYLPGKETLSIQSLAERTAVLAMSSI